MKRSLQAVQSAAGPHPHAGNTIGIELGDHWSRYCVLDASGTIVEEDRVRITADAMREKFGKLAPARVVIEAGIRRDNWRYPILDCIFAFYSLRCCNGTAARAAGRQTDASRCGSFSCRRHDCCSPPSPRGEPLAFAQGDFHVERFIEPGAVPAGRHNAQISSVVLSDKVAGASFVCIDMIGVRR